MMSGMGEVELCSVKELEVSNAFFQRSRAVYPRIKSREFFEWLINGQIDAKLHFVLMYVRHLCSGQDSLLPDV